MVKAKKGKKVVKHSKGAVAKARQFRAVAAKRRVKLAPKKAIKKEKPQPVEKVSPKVAKRIEEQNKKAEALITPRTKAIIATDYALNLCDHDTLTALAKKRSLTSGTIISHIEKLVGDGRLSLEGAQALAPKKVADGLEKIAAAAGTGGLRSLTPTFKKLQGRYTFDDLRFARILLSK